MKPRRRWMFPGWECCLYVCLRRRSIQPLTFRVFAVCVELTSFYICFCTDVEYFLFVFFRLAGLPLHLLDSLSPPDIFLSPSSATHIQCTHENKEKGNEVFTEPTLCVWQVEERSSWRQGPRVLPYSFPSIWISSPSGFVCNVICICIIGCILLGQSPSFQCFFLLACMFGEGKKDHRQFLLVYFAILIVVTAGEDRIFELLQVLSIIILFGGKKIPSVLRSQFQMDINKERRMVR